MDWDLLSAEPKRGNEICTTQLPQFWQWSSTEIWSSIGINIFSPGSARHNPKHRTRQCGPHTSYWTSLVDLHSLVVIFLCNPPTPTGVSEWLCIPPRLLSAIHCTIDLHPSNFQFWSTRVESRVACYIVGHTHTCPSRAKRLPAPFISDSSSWFRASRKVLESAGYISSRSWNILIWTYSTGWRNGARLGW